MFTRTHFLIGRQKMDQFLVVSQTWLRMNAENEENANGKEFTHWAKQWKENTVYLNNSFLFAFRTKNHFKWFYFSNFQHFSHTIETETELKLVDD